MPLVVDPFKWSAFEHPRYYYRYEIKYFISLWLIIITTWFKGTLIQIWKSANIFVFIWRWYAEDLSLKHLLLFQICAREICEKFAYKHSETIEYVKNWTTFWECCKRHGQITRQALELRMQNFWRYYFYMSTNIYGDFQICISVPLSWSKLFMSFWHLMG